MKLEKTCCCILLLLVTIISACNSPVNPKPRGYFRIKFPDREYQTFDKPGYPYTFEYPVYATIERDTAFFGGKPENPWWINVVFPQFDGKIYLSYKKIGNKYTIQKLVNDAYKMTYENALRADGIVTEMFQTPNNVGGLMYKVSGDAATSRQFFATDSVKNFLRGALYFHHTPNADSIAPVVDFLSKDIWHMLETLKWKKPAK